MAETDDPDMKRLSEEVLLDVSSSLYLIKRNGKEIALCEDRLCSIQIIDSLAAKEQTYLSGSEGVAQAFREDFLDDNRVVISTQMADGVIFASPVVIEVVYEFLSVHSAVITHPRLSKSEPRILDCELET